MKIKRGITVEWRVLDSGSTVLRIDKARGELTLNEIEEILRYGNLPNGSSLDGRYAILLNCTESTCGGNGLWDHETPKGDCVELYELSDGGDCPLCRSMLPICDNCPSCGEAIQVQG